MPSPPNLQISRILHAGYVFECGGTSILFDPIFENPFSRNCYAFPPVQFDPEQIRALKVAAIFISHFHDDHCSFESLDLLDRQTPLYVYCVFEELSTLLHELGFVHVHSLELNQVIEVGPFQITPWPALDRDVDSIFQIKAAGIQVLNVVDSWIDDSTLEKLAECAPWDMILWPFQTMREIEVLAPTRASAPPATIPPEWTAQLKRLDPRWIVPSSCQFMQEEWSWYNRAFFPISYRQFQMEVEAALPQARVVRLDPSVSVRLEAGGLSMDEPLSWVRLLDESGVDYDFDPNFARPTTAEIATRFPGLTADQTDQVYRYCSVGLPARHGELGWAEDPYFARARNWRLSVFDHAGRARDFHYQIERGELRELDQVPAAIDWTTEIPLAKLHAALETGEALTSLYMRINDFSFDPVTEGEIAEADIVTDPLIRCLYSGVFGAYQRAQLRKLGRHHGPMNEERAHLRSGRAINEDGSS